MSFEFKLLINNINNRLIFQVKFLFSLSVEDFFLGELLTCTKILVSERGDQLESIFRDLCRKRNKSRCLNSTKSKFIQFYVYFSIFISSFKRNIAFYQIYQECFNQKGKDRFNRMNIQGRQFRVRKEQVEIIEGSQKFQ